MYTESNLPVMYVSQSVLLSLDKFELSSLQPLDGSNISNTWHRAVTWNKHTAMLILEWMIRQVNKIRPLAEVLASTW